jgi:hypothetical protein
MPTAATLQIASLTSTICSAGAVNQSCRAASARAFSNSGPAIRLGRAN